MQDVPLTLNLVRERVERLYADKTVTTRYVDAIDRARYGDVLARSGRLADALQRLGVRAGDRVATLAWNAQHHLELYIAVPCMGAVLHTVNARLPGETIARLLTHAGDSVLFVDRSLARVLAGLAVPSALRHVVVMDDRTTGHGEEALPFDTSVLAYESFLDVGESDYAWPELDERIPSGLCYTSGTTGSPKGVVYSHRSTTLHTLACLFTDGIAMREREVCMPVVPMFHANGWGFPYAALMAGASLALPCRHTDPQSLASLIGSAGVTMATAVPTVWLDFLEALRNGRIAPEQIRTLKRIPMGGAAVSEALIAGFAEFGIEVTHCWGMTEISPLGLVNVAKSDLDPVEVQTARSAQGLPIPCCDVRTIGEDGLECARDGTTPGELQIRSPWAADSYFDNSQPGNRLPQSDAFVTDKNGRRWLRTGDIATIDRHGYVRIVDRTKDLIKSGGEWISSQALEAAIAGHPDVLEVAVVARPDARWQERPVAFLSLRDGVPDVRREHLARDLVEKLSMTLAKWQMPVDFIVMPSLPKGSTGKIDKNSLRRSFEAPDGVPILCK